MASSKILLVASCLLFTAVVTYAMPGYSEHIGHAESYLVSNLDSHGSSHGGHHEEHYADHHPKYQYKYGVEDKHTGDYKDAKEERDGDLVHGEYSLLQPDGRKRTVHYTASKHGGFNAHVSYSGHAFHPEVQHHQHHY